MHSLRAHTHLGPHRLFPLGEIEMKCELNITVNIITVCDTKLNTSTV